MRLRQPAWQPQRRAACWRLAQQSVMNDAELSLRPELLGLLAESETLMRARPTPAGI